MNLHVVVVAYALANELLTLYNSVVSQPGGDEVSWHIFQHGTNREVDRVLASLLVQSDNVGVYQYRANRGLAKSWNEGWINARESGATHIAIANDDAALGDGDLMKLIKTADSAPDHVGMVSGMGYDARYQVVRDQLFSFALLRPALWEKVGMFDENFWPIYWEDIDLYRRMELAGVTRTRATGTNIYHAGSQSLFDGPESDRLAHNARFHSSREYYERKWGGRVYAESFVHPFGNPAFGSYIAPHDRHLPYPGYQREDIETHP